jgi:phospholipid/cholesterol/gamma-HCH transport system substrate-binding protein
MTGTLRWTAIKLFIFTAVTIAVTLALASSIGNYQLFASPYRITAEFTDATGLLPGDVVKAAGVTIGRVDGIEIDDGIAVVSMSLDEGSQIPRGVSAEIRFRNLIGQRMVTLVDRSESSTDLLSNGDTIALENTRSAFDLTILFNGLRPLIRTADPDDINIVARELTLALKGRSDEVEGILTNLSAVAGVVAERDRTLTDLFDNLNVVTGDLAGRDAQLRRTLANLHTFLADVSASRDDLSQALVTLDEAATRFGRIIDANDANIQAELGDLSVVLDAIEDRRAALRRAVRSLPDMLVGVERVTSYGEWSMLHLVHVCKDDLGVCGKRVAP